MSFNSDTLEPLQPQQTVTNDGVPASDAQAESGGEAPLAHSMTPEPNPAPQERKLGTASDGTEVAAAVAANDTTNDADTHTVTKAA